jgi:hypothetical protein
MLALLLKKDDTGAPYSTHAVGAHFRVRTDPCGMAHIHLKPIEFAALLTNVPCTVY